MEAGGDMASWNAATRSTGAAIFDRVTVAREEWMKAKKN